AGRRVHHGVDIFAPRGTPVLAAAEGVVQPGTNRLGGNVVWQRVPGVGSLYYAHLDSQAVEAGEIARPGDTVGFVGNTGNAVTTPPHLHFGIYGRPRGPVDPFPFLYHPEDEPPEPLAADVSLGQFMRTTARRSVLRTGPDVDAAEIDTVVSGTIARVIGGAAEWRRVSLADGRTGFLRANELENAARPAATERTTAETPVWARPDSSSLAVATLPAGAEVAVLGSLGDWRLIALDGERGDTAGAPPRARSGWIPGG
ncbi:MAG: M23 family metallopeptidase, partial [Gemmatimonadota bacterium]|nr:M23 family metallopeptidase [Gemmatimonadota bacterium]